METLDAIFTRRSIRKFSNKKVTDSQVETILRAAMQAPSAFNRQPWHFVVVEGKHELSLLDSVFPYADMIKDSSVAILVCGDKDAEPSDEFIIQNNSAVTQNILLASHALGLGAVWIAVCGIPEILNPLKEHLKLPEYILPVSLVVIGYPAENIPAEDRYRPDKIHINGW